MNKYEENISEIITLNETEDIVYEFLGSAETFDGTVALIANRDLVEFAMDEAVKLDNFNFRRLDLELDDIEYMITIDGNGDMVVMPVEDLSDKYFKAIEKAYISMDGDVEQVVIDNCLDRNVEVILFGYEEDDDKLYECKCGCTDMDENESESTYISKNAEGVPVGFSKTWSTMKDGFHCYSSYSHYSNNLEMLKDIASGFGIKLK